MGKAKLCFCFTPGNTLFLFFKGKRKKI